MYSANWKKGFLSVMFILIGAVSLLSFNRSTATLAQSDAVFIREVRVLETEQTGVQNPVGLAFSPRGNAFHVIKGQERGQPPTAVTDIVKLSAYGEQSGSARITAAIKDPINVAYDQQFGRLLIFQSPNNHLLEVHENANGDLDPRTMIRHDVRHFGLQNPQGMAVDPLSGQLFILDAVGPQLVQVQPDADGTFERAVITRIDLLLHFLPV